MRNSHQSHILIQGPGSPPEADQVDGLDRQITADDVSGEWHCRLASCSESGSIVEIVVIPLGDLSTVSELLVMSELLEL